MSGTYKTISGLSAGTNYTYQIRSNNADGSGSYSAVKTITTIPNAPTRVSATATVDSVTVSWTAASGATGYEVYMNNKTYTTSGTSIKITGLASNTSYAYRVRSKMQVAIVHILVRRQLGLYSRHLTRLQVLLLVRPIIP